MVLINLIGTFLMQAKLRGVESQLNEACLSTEARSESRTMALSTSNAKGEDMDSVSVTKKLEEELLKRDALIEVCHS